MKKQDESKWFVILLMMAADLKDPISFPWISAKLTNDEADFYFGTIIPALNRYLNILDPFDIPPGLISVSQKNEWTSISLNFFFDLEAKDWASEIIPREVSIKFGNHAKEIEYFEKMKQWMWNSEDKLDDRTTEKYISPEGLVSFYLGKDVTKTRSKVKISAERLSTRSKHIFENKERKEEFEKEWKEIHEPAFRKKLGLDD